MLIKEFRW